MTIYKIQTIIIKKYTNKKTKEGLGAFFLNAKLRVNENI
jgi:hypothetical protein